MIIIVLLQADKGEGLAGAFGGGGDQTVFGGHETATFLSKATTYLAVLFMVLSLTLALLTNNRGVGTPDSALRRSQQQGQGNLIQRGESPDAVIGAAADTAGTVSPDSQ